jgi:hypothetical protein
MRFSNCVRAWLLALALAGPSAAGAAERVEMPLDQRVLSNGTIRYFVNLSIAGVRPLAAMLDTGSTGLRILSNVVPDSAFASISDQSNIYGYGSGVRLNGVVATLRAGLGRLSGPEPISAQLVRTVDCYPKRPNCPASRISQADYRIGGDGLPKEGFEAILGISMGKGPVDNPLRQLGAQTWIVILPRPGENRPGALILNPDAAELAGYTLLPTELRLKNSQEGGALPKGIPGDSVPGCLVIEKSGKRICGPTLLDTGAPGIGIHSSNPEDHNGWKKGDRLAIVFRNKRGGEVQSSFQAGAGRPSQVRASAPQAGASTETHISAGTLPYFHISVFYDDQQHLVGLSRR